MSKPVTFEAVVSLCDEGEAESYLPVIPDSGALTIEEACIDAAKIKAGETATVRITVERIE